MTEPPRFLRPNAIIEPLVDRFYAWPHTVAPVPASMHLALLQLPMLESYLKSPQVHLAACANPALRGGYFVNIAEQRSGEIRDLVDGIRRDRAPMLRLAEAIGEAEALLRQEANGFDLTPLYAKLPAELRGMVELAYDCGNQPTMRYIEPATYRRAGYLDDRQSVQLSIEPGVERPFIFSTPRLPAPDVLDLDIPFRHEGLRELFAARLRPSTLGRLREALEVPDDRVALLERLLTDEPGQAPDRNIEAGGRIRYFGHACLLLQSPEATVLTDPFINADTNSSGRYLLRDLPDHIDLVIITHGHQDHIVLETILQLRGRVGRVVVPRSSRGNLCDPSLGLYLKHMGLPVIEVDDYEEVEFPGGKVTATPFLGEHADLDIRAKSTYWVQIAGRKVFVGADSSGLDPTLYHDMRAELGQVDMAFLGMECDGAPLTWMYQPLLTRPVTKKMSDSRKLSGSNAEQAGAIVTELGANEVYIYAMGEEDWLGHVMATSYTPDSYQLKQIEVFLGWCAAKGIKAEHLLGQREWRW
jgi:L-ascorbate metabolism protein UlaG (beta-lactamase superfamily)